VAVGAFDLIAQMVIGLYRLVNGMYDTADWIQTIYLLTLTLPIILLALLSDLILILHILLIRFRVNAYEHDLCKQLPDLADYILTLSMTALLAKLALLGKGQCR
jgi:hypothetical protein